jgi:hypothetical protein
VQDIDDRFVSKYSAAWRRNQKKVPRNPENILSRKERLDKILSRPPGMIIWERNPEAGVFNWKEKALFTSDSRKGQKFNEYSLFVRGTFRISGKMGLPCVTALSVLLEVQADQVFRVNMVAYAIRKAVIG